MGSTAKPVTDEDIRTLRHDAMVVQNALLAALCTRALDGEEGARRRVTHIRTYGHDLPRGPLTDVERAGVTAAGMDPGEIERGMLARQAAERAGCTCDPAGAIFVSVLKAMPSNFCPVCGKVHREGTQILARHAAEATAMGYTGYNYDFEVWMSATGLA